MRSDAAIILAGMGSPPFDPIKDFRATQHSDGSVSVEWLSAQPQPSEDEIDAAAPAVLAAVAADAADASALVVDKADLRAQVSTAVARLEQIRDASSHTNAQLVAAVQDMARYQLAIIKVLRR